MAKSAATDVDGYLNELEPGRRQTIVAVRELILRNLPVGYEESLAFGMIGYGIPLSRYPKTYNGQPLAYLSLASQKKHCALYMMAVYMSPELDAKLRKGFRASGRELDFGKSCLRFRDTADLPLDVIGELVAAVPPDEYIRWYEASRQKK